MPHLRRFIHPECEKLIFSQSKGFEFFESEDSSFPCGTVISYLANGAKESVKSGCSKMTNCYQEIGLEVKITERIFRRR